MAITKVDLANVVTGVLPVANGGTGGSSYTATQWTTTGSDIYYNTGNVGIGTSSPAVKLDVRGGSINWGSVDGVSIGELGYTSGDVYMANSNSGKNIRFYTNATERLRLDSSGNLGLGVTPSTWSVGKAIQIGTTGAAIADGSGSMYWVNNAYYNSGWKYLTSTGASYYLQAGNVHYWFNAPSGTAGNAITFTPAMTLDDSGNLLVNSPSNGYNGIKFANDGNSTFYNTSSITLAHRQQWSSSYTASEINSVLSGASSYLTFSTNANWTNGNAAERMRIDSSGNVGIGSSETSIFTGVAGTGKLVVTGNNSATDPANNQDSCIVIANTNDTTNNTAALHFAWQDTDNTPNFASASIVGILGTKVANQYAAGQLAFLTSSATNSAPSEKMRLSAAGGFSVGTTADPGAGAIYATGNITAYYSDDRLKTKLGGIENALDKVKSLSGFYYEANQTAQDLGYQPVREVGVSAQQVQAVLPEVVKPAPIDQQYLTVDYERLVPLLIEAIKELEEKVAKLEAK